MYLHTHTHRYIYIYVQYVYWVIAYCSYHLQPSFYQNMNGNGSDSSGEYDEGNILDNRQTVLICVSGTLALLGLVGNIISFRTFGKMMAKNATTLLLRALAVFDSCVLLLNFVCYAASYAEDIWSHPVWMFANTYIIPFLHIAFMANAGTSVIIGANRYIAVCRPLQAARLCTAGHARKQLSCVVLFSIAYGLPRFFSCTITKSDDGSEYIRKALLRNKVWYAYFYIIGCEMIFRFIIPFALLLFFCVRLTTTLREARKQLLDLHGGRRVDTRVTSMLVTLLGVFLISNAPNFIYNSLRIILMHDIQFTRSWTGMILSDTADIFVIMNSSINWFIYVAYIREFRERQCERYTRGKEQSQDCGLQ